MRPFFNAHPAQKGSSASLSRPIPILKTGRFVDASGNVYDITPEMLQDIAASTEPQSAPLVKGHAENNAPAQGWVQSLKAAGGKLFAVFAKPSPEFAEDIKNGAFRNVSASFFMPFSPSNPKKGHYVLRHVAALGATRPAIPGLGTLQDAFASTDGGFCADAEAVAAFCEFNSPPAAPNIMNSIKGFFGLDWEQKLTERITAEVLRAVPQFNEQQNPRPDAQGEQMTPREQELEAQLKASQEAKVKADAELKKAQVELERRDAELKKAETHAALKTEAAKALEGKDVPEADKQSVLDKIVQNASALMDTGKTAAEAVAAFAEYLPAKKHTNKNWANPPKGKGTANFSEGSLVNSPEFAAKKAEYEKQGLSPSQAYQRSEAELAAK